jgi:hypothetical protein
MTVSGQTSQRNVNIGNDKILNDLLKFGLVETTFDIFVCKKFATHQWF